jgi:hypothetical protein
MATLEGNKLVYTPAPAPKKTKKGAIPKFLQENDKFKLATSSQDTTSKEDKQVIENKEQVRESMELISKPHPSIDPEKEPNVWDDDEGS